MKNHKGSSDSVWGTWEPKNEHRKTEKDSLYTGAVRSGSVTVQESRSCKEQQRLQEHIAQWRRDLEDFRNRGSSIDGKKLLNEIQLILNFAGFIPVLV